MGVRLARRQRPRAHLEKRMIVHDHAGDKRLLRVALVVLARASARAATVVAVAALAVTLALAESVAAFEPVAVIGGGGGGAEKLGDATDGLALAESVAFEPVAVIGGSGGGAGKLAIPLGVATDGVGGLYATEHVNQRVSRFTTAGEFAQAWGFDVIPGGGEGFEVCTQATGCKRGESGGRAGQMSFPTGIAAVGGGLYVADGNSRISEFTTEGSFVRAFEIGRAHV